MSVRISEFDYFLPRDLIAQEPPEKRDRCRLMVLDRDRRTITHARFWELPRFLPRDTTLIANDSKVWNARFFGTKEPTGARIELVFLDEVSRGIYTALARPLKRLKEGTRVTIGPAAGVEVIKKLPDRVVVRVRSEKCLKSVARSFGTVPLPRYIRRPATKKDARTYQNVFAKKEGSIACPTAGLHFSKGLLDALRKKGIATGMVTLHVSYATFKEPTREELASRRLEKEYIAIDKPTAALINAARARGKKILAVGTTVCRTLESCAYRSARGYRARAAKKYTDMFIYPGYRFKMVDMLITNFHLPRTTVVMLVAAFCGKEFLFKAYQEAIRERYRFYSYGDGMLII
jgi:S-adenosylmethionine:tRNA ribosyltransferase-isomerase